MSQFTEPSHPPVPNLETLEADPAPTFVIKISSTPLPFELLFCNNAFRNAKIPFRQDVLAQDLDALLFRSWAQALGGHRPIFEFANQRWSAVRAGRDGGWKVVRAFEPIPEKQNLPSDIITERQQEEDRGLNTEPSIDTAEARRLKRENALRNMPRMDQLESLQLMMEISDVGVFEFDITGRLLHANEAWYRMRYIYAMLFVRVSG